MDARGEPLNEPNAPTLPPTSTVRPSSARLHPMPKLYVHLGRNGDLLNLLPWWRRESMATGQPVKILTRPDYLPLLSGYPYVEAFTVDVPVGDSRAAFRHASTRFKGHQIIVSQVENNPNDARRLTPNYQMEAWRLAGALSEWGKWPLVIDHPASTQAEESKPTLLVAPGGISSPFPASAQLMTDLHRAFGEVAHVIDITNHIFATPQHLVPILNSARCLVTVDTMHLHLSRACRVPVVALLQDKERWLGSLPPPACVAHFGYRDAAGDMAQVVRAVERVMREFGPRVIHVCDRFGLTERHERAKASWVAAGLEGAPNACNFGRSARNIGDPRALPYFKDVLSTGMCDARDDDVILWTNDDICVLPGLVPYLRRNVSLFGAVSMRRDATHMGRDLFAFTAGWLRRHWEELPDYIQGASDFDLGVAAMIRAKRGIVTCLENLSVDFYPCDAAERLYTHDEHPSEWNRTPDWALAPSVRHNRRLFRDWAERHCPEIRFHHDGLVR